MHSLGRLGTNYGSETNYTNPVDKDLVIVTVSSSQKNSNIPKSILDRKDDDIPRIATESDENVFFYLHT